MSACCSNFPDCEHAKEGLFLMLVDSAREALGKVDPTSGRDKDSWKTFFEFYNNPANGNRWMSMNCGPCYMKVYYWVKKYFQNEIQKKTSCD